jgi:hypothetical protein
VSAHRNLTASQEARRRAHELAPRRDAERTTCTCDGFGEGVAAHKLVLALWRELDEERPGGLTCLDVARVAEEHWGKAVEQALWRETLWLIAAGLLRQVGVVVVRDRGQVSRLPIFEPAERWHSAGAQRSMPSGEKP